MHRDEIVRPEEEVDVARGEPVLLLPEVDAVQDQVEVAVVGFDLGMVDRAERVFDGERVKMKDVGQEPAFLGRRCREVNPERDPATAGFSHVGVDRRSAHVVSPF